MKNQKFNEGWRVSKIDGKILGKQINGFPEGKQVTLPHDAMIEEQPQRDCPNMTQTAHYPGGCYRYVKEFIAPVEWQEQTVALEFEGAYMNSRVYLNNDYVGGCHYGYSDFSVNLDHSLLYGKKNRIEVIVNNEMLNSRWYSGSGLYRNVWLHIGDPVHIAMNGVQISTPDIEKDTAIVLAQPLVKNHDRLNHRIMVKTEIFDAEGNFVTEETSTSLIYGNTDKYNGQQVKLRGACIHHDNGIIGACTLELAEERRCRLLKEAGFNCKRTGRKMCRVWWKRISTIHL